MSGGSLCSLGSNDNSPAGADSHVFAALDIVDGSTQNLKTFEYDVTDYTAVKPTAGYICEKEGNYIYFE